MKPVCRAQRPDRAVALESTLLAHGLPAGEGRPFADELCEIVRRAGAEPVTVGVLNGQPIAGLADAELDELLATPDLPKANTANLGALIHAGRSAATTVSTTMEIASAAGVRTFATGGLGGVHEGYGSALDISSDLAAFTRFPVAVVTAGVKSILDVVSTREALETLGIPVVGFRTDRFPAFYLRESDAGVDARFDDTEPLADFIAGELARTGRGMVVCNPIPEADELDRAAFAAWLEEARGEAVRSGATGRAVTPAVLGALHRISSGRTLAANLALVRSNTALAGRLAASMP